MYGSAQLVKVGTQTSALRRYFAVVMRAISQITIQRVSNTFNLGPEYSNNMSLVNDNMPNMASHKS
jgi:hypothetical protein